MGPDKDMEKKIVIYSRKSRFTGKGESVGNQVEMCRQYIQLHFGKEAADRSLVYEDEGFSGGNLERPQFKQMMADAEKKCFQAVVVYRLDRISRNIGDFAGLIQRLKELEVDFISIKEQFDTSSPMGRAMMYISSVFSQLERETIAERIRDNMNELAKTGRWLGGRTPAGYGSESYSYPAADGKTKQACRLKLVPEEGRIVKEIYQTFLETGSLTETEERLDAAGIRTKAGKPFSRFAVKAILSNPVYAAADPAAWDYFSEKGAGIYTEKERFDGRYGIMAYNRTIQQKGKADRIRPEKEWILAAGKHEPLVDGETWVKVQKLLERNRSKTYKKTRSSQALLPGLLLCGNCKSPMRPKASSRVNGNGETRFSYVCTLKEKSRGRLCSMKNADGNALDEGVLKVLSGLKTDEETFVSCLEKGRKRLREKAWKEGGLSCKKNIRLEGQIRNLAAALAQEKEGEARSYILAEMERLCKQKAALKEDQRSAEVQEIPAEKWKGFSPFLPDSSFPISVEERRMAIRSLIETVVWDGSKAAVKFSE